MYGQMATTFRLKSRMSLHKVSSALENDPSQSITKARKYRKTVDIRGRIEQTEHPPVTMVRVEEIKSTENGR